MAGWNVAQRCRVVVDNDWAGDPDGLVALAHHLLSPGHRVEAVTSSLLSPAFGPPEGGAERGARLAAELVGLVGGAHRPPVHAGADHPWAGGGGEPAGAGRGVEPAGAGARAAGPTADPGAAARAIVRVARRDDPLPLVVVCGGPLTNVSEALRLDPGIASRLTLSWVGGCLDGGPEYNQDTDSAAAAHVLSTPGLGVRQFPLQTYRRLAWSVAQLEDALGGCGPLGTWLWQRFVELPLPPGFAVDAVWPLGDSGPLIGTALSHESSDWQDERGRQVCTRVDDRLLFGDMTALFRRHARLAVPAR